MNKITNIWKEEAEEIIKDLGGFTNEGWVLSGFFLWFAGILICFALGFKHIYILAFRFAFFIFFVVMGLYCVSKIPLKNNLKGDKK